MWITYSYQQTAEKPFLKSVYHVVPADTLRCAPRETQAPSSVEPRTKARGHRGLGARKPPTVTAIQTPLSFTLTVTYRHKSNVLQSGENTCCFL